MKQREINEDLIEVWSDIILEKMHKLQDRVCNLDYESLSYHKIRGMIDGYAEALTLLSCLRQGRFKNKYDETLRKIKEECIK